MDGERWTQFPEVVAEPDAVGALTVTSAATDPRGQPELLQLLGP